jgi:hypothetical protein
VLVKKTTNEVTKLYVEKIIDEIIYKDKINRCDKQDYRLNLDKFQTYSDISTDIGEIILAYGKGTLHKSKGKWLLINAGSKRNERFKSMEKYGKIGEWTIKI